MTAIKILWVLWFTAFGGIIEGFAPEKIVWQYMRLALMPILLLSIIFDAFLSLGVLVLAWVLTFVVEKMKVA